MTYAYDGDGNVTEMVYPSGRIVTYSRDALGRISGVTTRADASSPTVTLASAVTWQAFGPLASLTYGNGLLLTRSYDDDYRLDVLRIRDPASGINQSHRDHVYQDGINLTRVVEAAVAGRNETYGYTAANRLQTATGPWGTLTWSYDLTGNRTQEVLTSGATTTSVYDYPPPATSSRP